MAMGDFFFRRFPHTNNFNIKQYPQLHQYIPQLHFQTSDGILTGMLTLGQWAPARQV
jgi:hypothetical protein